MRARAALYVAGALTAAAASVVAWTADRGDDSRVTGARSPAAALDGASLFRAKGCATCHIGPGSGPGESFEVGPNLSDAASWAGTRVAGMSAGDYIAQSIRDPVAMISPEFTGGAGPTTGMPALDVSDAEVDALVAYLLAP